MGYKEKILELLDGNKLTVKELTEKFGLIQKYIQKDNKETHKPNTKDEARIKAESDIKVYINRIQKDKLKVVGKENKYKSYTLNKELDKSNPDDFEKLKGITKSLIEGENISNDEEKWLVKKCQL